MSEIRVFVAGEPQSKGSTKAFYIKKLERTVTTDSNPRNKQWQLRVAMEVQRAVQEAPGWFSDDRRIGYEVEAMFRFTKPKSTPKRWTLMTKRPDLDKTMRSLGDALTHIAFPDDSQIVKITIGKRYCEPGEMPGVDAVIRKIED